MKNVMRIVAFLLKVIFVFLPTSCNAKPPIDGLFWGEKGFVEFTKDYSLSKKEAENVLKKHLEESGEKYWYYPFQVVYANKGGYLFVTGDFKVSIQFRGFFVNEKGEVSKFSSKKFIDIKKYKGNWKVR